jgi:hypothetical protein
MVGGGVAEGVTVGTGDGIAVGVGVTPPIWQAREAVTAAVKTIAKASRMAILSHSGMGGKVPSGAYQSCGSIPTTAWPDPTTTGSKLWSSQPKRRPQATAFE